MQTQGYCSESNGRLVSKREPLGQDPDVSRWRLTLGDLSRKGTYVQHGGGPQGFSGGGLGHQPGGDAAWIKAQTNATDRSGDDAAMPPILLRPALWLLNLALSPSFLPPAAAGEPWSCSSPTAARKPGKMVSGSLFQSLMGKWLCLLRLGIPQAQEGGHTLGNQKE